MILLDALRDTDRTVVSKWLEAFLEEHVQHWAPLLDLGTTSDQIRAYIADKGLVSAGWKELQKAAEGEGQLVRVARIEKDAVGIVHAAVRTDPILRCPVGALQWVYVAEAQRCRGLGRELSKTALTWMKEHGCSGTELFVRQTNEEAMALYEQMGYTVSDCRMIRSLEG